MTKKALIIDDDRWFAEVVEKALQTAGWTTKYAQNGSQGIDAIDQFLPSVLVLDFMLPEISAPALLNELQSHTDLAELPVVLCTSLDTKQLDLSVLKSYGVRAVIDKTKDTPHDIVGAIENAIQ